MVHPKYQQNISFFLQTPETFKHINSDFKIYFLTTRKAIYSIGLFRLASAFLIWQNYLFTWLCITIPNINACHNYVKWIMRKKYNIKKIMLHSSLPQNLINTLTFENKLCIRDLSQHCFRLWPATPSHSDRVATLWPGQNSLPFPNLFLTHAPIFPTNEMHSAIFSIQSMIECSMTCIHVSTFCVRGFLNLTPCWEGSTYECHKYACLVSSQWLQGNIDADGTPCFFFQKYFTSINTKMI